MASVAACCCSRSTSAFSRLSRRLAANGYAAAHPQPQQRRARALAAAATKAPGQRSGAAAAPPPAQQAAADTNPPRGTRDFPPSEMRRRTWLFEHFRRASEMFGFEEWDGPVLESEALFVRKAGEEVTEQLFNFEDKGGRRVALRPELTPSLARIILSKGAALPLPAKWFAVGQCWRYERTSRGRRREHYQWNMDCVGVAGVSAEAELMAAIVCMLERVGLTKHDVGLKVSSRKLLAGVLASSGVPESLFARVCVEVDKLDKVGEQAVRDNLAALGVSAEAIDGVLRGVSLTSLDELAGLLGEESEVVVELRELWSLAEGYGISGWLEFDASVVRGLAYYTGVVFEGFDRAGELRAICGGGRYDDLLKTMSGGRDKDSKPMVGFGFGDAVITELLEAKGLLPSFDKAQIADDVVVAMDATLRSQARRVAAALRAKGRRVEMVLEESPTALPKKMKWMFKHCERVGAERLVMVGAKEWESGEKVAVKLLAEREQSVVGLDEL